MGRKKSRHTVKSGSSNKKKNKNVVSLQNDDIDLSDDDQMYSKVDKFHEEEEIKLDRLLEQGRGGYDDDDDDDDDDDILKRDDVLDLGLADDDGDDDDDDESLDEESFDDEDDDDDDMALGDAAVSSSDDDSDDDENAKKSDLLQWGTNKKSYYHGDTADLEIGQDEEDAFAEEEAGKEVLKMRYDNMDESDFLLFGGDQQQRTSKDDDDGGARKQTKSAGDTAAAAAAEVIVTDKIKSKMDYGSEFLPLVDYFDENAVTPLKELVCVAMEQVEENKEEMEAIGLTNGGQSYLQLKQMLLLTTVLNFTNYLLLKSSAAAAENEMTNDATATAPFDIKSHPVIERLNDLNDIMALLKDKVEVPCGLMDQLEKIRKAIDMVKNDDYMSSDDDGDDNDIKEEEEMKVYEDEEMMEEEKDIELSQNNNKYSDASSSDEDDESLRNESLFAPRAQDMSSNAAATPSASTSEMLEYGDDDINPTTSKTAGRELSKTLNTLQQKRDTRKEKKNKRRGDDVNDDDDEKIKMGLEMMEDMLGPASDDDEDNGDNKSAASSTSSTNSYYEKTKRRALVKKSAREAKYAPTPLFPTMTPTLEDGEERALSKKIMRNRGLVAHKSKGTRNPRVKKREQYRKALLRRKGAVREVRTGEEDAYGGETTGIRSGISRSRKLDANKK